MYKNCTEYKAAAWELVCRCKNGTPRYHDENEGFETGVSSDSMPNKALVQLCHFVF